MPARTRTRSIAMQEATQDDDDIEVEVASGEDMDVSEDGEDAPEEEEVSGNSDDEGIGKRRNANRATAPKRTGRWKKSIRSEGEGGDDDNENDVEDEVIEEEDEPEEDEIEEPDELNSEEYSSEHSESEAPVQRTPKSSKPRIKIMLKFNKVSANTTPTPSEEAAPIRRGRKGVVRDVSVESEDDDEDDDGASTRSTSYAGPSRLTQRQAAMKGFVEKTDYVSLDEPTSKRKKHLNETELALKREETARKRKNLSVKKLEDEKAETINRLLKKQSRPRGKKSTATTADVDEEIDPDAEDASVPVPVPALPTLFRWVSSSKPDTPALSFSVPVAYLPDQPPEGENGVGVGGAPIPPLAISPLKPPEPKPVPLCDVKGCQLPRKYKLVKNPTMGGCGMEHLKMLQV